MSYEYSGSGFETVPFFEDALHREKKLFINMETGTFVDSYTTAQA